MHILHQWISSMEESPGGVATLSNIFYDCVNGHLPIDVIREIFNQVQNALNENQSLKGLDVFFEVISSPNNLCKGDCISSAPQFSRVQDAQSFVKRNVDFTKTTFGITPVPLTTDQWEVLKKLDGSIFGKGSLGNRRGFAWVTQTENLQKLQEETSSDDIATVIRNRLGLCILKDDGNDSINIVGRYANELLIEIKYPAINIVSPTFAEGASEEGLSFYRSHRSNNGWGQTVSLNNSENGMPEAVHSEVSFGEGFSVSIIGVPRPLTVPFVEENFLSCFPDRWRPDLIDRLLIAIGQSE
jgi:hypothetical protein